MQRWAARHFSTSRVCKLQPKNHFHPPPVFVNKVSLEHSSTHVFPNCLYNGRIESLQQNVWPSNLKIFTIYHFVERVLSALLEMSSQVLKAAASLPVHISRVPQRRTQWKALGLGSADLRDKPFGKIWRPCSPVLLLWLSARGWWRPGSRGWEKQMPVNSEAARSGNKARRGPELRFWSADPRRKGLWLCPTVLPTTTRVCGCVRERECRHAWGCVCVWLQACVCDCRRVCVIAGVHVCLEGGPSQDVSLGHTGGNRAPWPECLRIEAETHSQRQMITKSWATETDAQESDDLYKILTSVYSRFYSSSTALGVYYSWCLVHTIPAQPCPDSISHSFLSLPANRPNQCKALSTIWCFLATEIFLHSPDQSYFMLS